MGQGERSRPRDALVAFFQQHRRCGKLESGIDDRWGWMVCDCGAQIIQRIVRTPERYRRTNEQLERSASG